jgi:Xaa-Pro aminopeptidase
MHRFRPAVIGGLLASAVVFAASAPAGPGESIYQARREAVIARIGTDLAVVPAQVSSPRGVQDNTDFFYLTGLGPDRDALLVLGGGGEGKEVLFTRTGKWGGEGTPGSLDVRPLANLRMVLFSPGPDRKIYLPFSGLESALQSLGGGFAVSRAAGLAPLETITAPMRIVKSAEEVAILRKAIAVTTEAYVEALAALRPGITEADINALIQFTNLRHGATSSFTQVASGPNSVNIHFDSTPRPVQGGEVIVFDLGAWFDRYTSDVSRTVPVGGRFTKEQAEIYDLVLRAQKEAISLMTPGHVAIEPTRAAEAVLMRGLRDLGLVTDPDSPLQKRMYIQHGFCHGIGLDIHDVYGWWGPRMETEPLRPGMVLTMEPGLYFPPDRLERFAIQVQKGKDAEEWKAFSAAVAPVYAKYAGLGCRIEDDILVTENGTEVLSSAAPKEIRDIEAAMKRPSPFDKIFK